MEEKENPTTPVVLNKTETPVKEAPAVVEKLVESTETQEQINWKKFREVREKERKEKEESDKKAKEKEQEAAALKAALEAVLNKTQNSAPPETNEEEDEIQKRVDEAIRKRDAQNEQARVARERAEEPAKLRQTFPDFEKVCSQENVDYLEYHHPETFAAFKAMPDSFEKWSRVYNAMKRYIPNSDASKDAARAERNLKKPQSMSTGLTQTGDTQPIMGLSEERKRDNWKRMQESMRRGV